MNRLANSTQKPAPPVSDLSRPYWDAAREGRLVLQSCTACGTLRHYPRLLCSVCYCKAVTWPAADLPYTLVTVDLQEGVRPLGRWRGAQAPTIGMPVAGAFETRSGGVDLVFQATPS